MVSSLPSLESFAFSLSLPFTKLALKSFDPLFTAFARPVIAACLAIPLMLIAKVPKLPRELWRPTAFTALGAVFGWPILIALALQRTTSAHVSVIAAVMPLVTAIIAVIKHRKHPGTSFLGRFKPWNRPAHRFLNNPRRHF